MALMLRKAIYLFDVCLLVLIVAPSASFFILDRLPAGGTPKICSSLGDNAPSQILWEIPASLQAETCEVVAS